MVGTKKSISESCPPMIDRPDKKAGFCSCSAAFSDRASAKTHTNTKNTERKTTTNTHTHIKTKISILGLLMEKAKSGKGSVQIIKMEI